MLRSFIWLIVFAAIWLLLSGVYKPITVALGAASCLVVLFVFRRMEDASPSGPLYIRLSPIRLVMYSVWLIGEIAKSTWAVTKVILSPEMPIRQHFFKVPTHQNYPVGRTIFANSITLTPGTITVETEDNHFLVHALQFDDTDMDGLADMESRVCGIEVKGE